MARPRIVIAMSGGVDSSVAAALLVDQGYEVIGLMAHLWVEEATDQPGESANRCCAPEAVDDARRVASLLGIPFYQLGFEAAFKSGVVDPFISEYGQGRTPNPCLACNKHIRFGKLLQHALELGASHLATGHYARIDRVDGRFRLLKGADTHKDQSYVLYMLGQAELRRVLFPIGHMTKGEVRDLARHLGLPVADRAESMDLCFVRDHDCQRFLKEHAPAIVQPGPILDTAGREIGQHQGIAFYTIGQRKGIGIAASTPLYVIRLEVARNAVVVGPACALGRRSLVVEAAHYPAGILPEEPARVDVKVRYRAAPAPATWTPRGERAALVQFDHSVRDITPGQAAVAYREDMLVAGGIISE